jgi:tape measure domain-containing protein
MANNPVTEIDIRTQQAQRNLDQLRQAFDSAGKTAGRLEDALTTQNQTYLKLAAATDSAARARQQYEALERRAGAALDANKISAEQYSRLLDAQTEKLKKVADAQNQMTNSGKASTESSLSFLATAGKYGLIVTAIKEVADTFTAVQRTIAQAGDQVAMMTVRANLATERLMGGGQSFGEIARIAQAVGAPLEATAGLFARIGRSAADAGATSVQEVSRATEIVQKLAIASGATVQEASSGALQLGQALASGRLSGDELRTILETMPSLGQAIAKEFGVGVGQLRDMGAAGELVSDRVFKAILNAGSDADRMFAALPKTVERASTEMSNAWTLFLAQLDRSLGVSKGIVSAMEAARRVAEGATRMVAPAGPDAQLANERERLRVLDANQPIVQSRFDRAENDQTRAEILKNILALENQIGAAAAAADADDQRRVEAQKQALADRLAGLEKERAADLAKAEVRSRLSRQAIEELEAREKAETAIRAKLVGLSDADQKAQAKAAGDQAVALLRLKQSAEDRWKAEAEGARAAEKAATDAARQAEKNAVDSARAAAQEQEARDRALETVAEQVNRLEDEAAAISLGARERAVLAERLKAETALKKGLVDVDQELYQAELKRVELAAGQKFDSERSNREAERAATDAARIAERQAEEAARPMRNLFDNLQRGTAQIFEGLFTGTLNVGQAFRKVLLNAAAEYLSAVAVTPALRSLGSAVGLGSGQPGSGGGGFQMPGFGGGGLMDGLTSRIDSFGSSVLGTAAPGAVGGWTVTGVGGPSASALNAANGAGALSSYLPFAGVGVGALMQFAQGNVGGGIGTLGGAGLGFLAGGPVGMGIGAALGGFLGGAFGGKKPSVGPGGGIGFGVGADGKVNVGFTSQDNNYDAVAKNLDAAQSVADAAAKLIERLGGKFTGTAVAGRGAELGYDAGLKMFTGGDDTSGGRGRFKTLEEAMAASVTAIIKNATTTGLSKDIQDRLAKVATSQDLETLLQYVDGLRSLRDGFVNWQEPLTQAETAMAGLKAAFEQANAAATSLSSSTDEVKASYEKQRMFLVSEFNRPLEERFLRATNQNAAADEMVRAKAEADLRKQAAALGAEAVLQVEKTLAAERLKEVGDQRAVIEQASAARRQQLQASADVLAGVMGNIAAAMDEALRAWRGVAEQVQKFTDSLGLSAVSPLSPEEQLNLATRQYRDLLGRAMGGDVTAAQGVTGAAQTLLERGRGFYASSAGYADLYGRVTGDLTGLSAFARGDAQTNVTNEYTARIIALRDARNEMLRGFASGGMVNAGEVARVHPGELLYTGPRGGPTRVFNPSETNAILGGGQGISRLEAKLDQLIRVVAASGQMNAETQAAMAEALDAIRRKANLASSDPMARAA